MAPGRCERAPKAKAVPGRSLASSGPVGEADAKLAKAVIEAERGCPGSGAPEASSRAGARVRTAEETRALPRPSLRSHFTLAQAPPDPRAEAQSRCQEERSLRAAMFDRGAGGGGGLRARGSVAECAAWAPASAGGDGGEGLRTRRGGLEAWPRVCDVLGASRAARPRPLRLQVRGAARLGGARAARRSRAAGTDLGGRTSPVAAGCFPRPACPCRRSPLSALRLIPRSGISLYLVFPRCRESLADFVACLRQECGLQRDCPPTSLPEPGQRPISSISQSPLTTPGPDLCRESLS